MRINSEYHIRKQHTPHYVITECKMSQPKRHSLKYWINKQGASVYCLQEMPLTSIDVHRLKGKGWKMILHANESHGKKGMLL